MFNIFGYFASNFNLLCKNIVSIFGLVAANGAQHFKQFISF